MRTKIIFRDFHHDKTITNQFVFFLSFCSLFHRCNHCRVIYLETFQCKSWWFKIIIKIWWGMSKHACMKMFQKLINFSLSKIWLLRNLSHQFLILRGVWDELLVVFLVISMHWWASLSSPSPEYVAMTLLHWQNAWLQRQQINYENHCYCQQLFRTELLPRNISTFISNKSHMTQPVFCWYCG